MTVADDVELVGAPLGYAVLIQGESAGAIEGTPGKLEYLVIEQH